MTVERYSHFHYWHSWSVRAGVAHELPTTAVVIGRTYRKEDK